jgi:hypothetical protein
MRCNQESHRCCFHRIPLPTWLTPVKANTVESRDNLVHPMGAGSALCFLALWD